MTSPRERSRQRLAGLAALLVAGIVGAWLRLDQIGAQVLIDDEWHAVHQVLHRTPQMMLLDFGIADYSIPLGILDWHVAHWWGLSEIAMRGPMLVCGLVTLVAVPLYVAPRLGRATAVVFALLVAISPLLVVYSRMARPYAITLLLGWIAHAAFQRYHAAREGKLGAALAYGTAATLVAWLHPVAALFVLAPPLWALFQLRRVQPAERRSRFIRVALAAVPTGIAIAVLVVPPLVAHPESLAIKSGIDMPGVATLAGVWYAWLGTPWTMVVAACLFLAAIGAPSAWHALPEVRTGALGVALTLAAIVLTRPMWSQNAVTLARYLLPFLTMLLLCVAAGTVRIATRIARPATVARRALAAAFALLPLAALLAGTPLAPMLRHPNAQTNHLMHYFDFRAERNPYFARFELIPLSPFWASLATRPAGSLRIVAAPFYFESFNWDAPRWERISGQTVLPGYLTGLCVDRRWGEVPPSPTFRFRNAVHLADGASLARRDIDYVVWQKPYVQTDGGHRVPIGEDTAHCEAALRAKFGPPAFEDSAIIAFRVPPPNTPAASAQR